MHFKKDRVVKFLVNYFLLVTLLDPMNNIMEICSREYTIQVRRQYKYIQVS